ncbi:MAG: hypothetical protein ABIJ39_07185 [Chloroflexota bacterium]
MKNKYFAIASLLLISIFACQTSEMATIPTLQVSPFESGVTAFGFFPSPPEATLQSILTMYADMGQHADVVLLQQAIPWQEFVVDPDGDSQRIIDIHNQYLLARQNGLDIIFVVDPLNGLNRRVFMDLPEDWEPGFGNPDVRSAFMNFALRIVREFQPRYLGLASEINTYIDAHPEDFANYLSLYNMVYGMVKLESPETQIFVTFQWEDLNNLISEAAEDRQAYQTNWDQVEAFEPNLDLWVISSYPFVVFESGAAIPADYYTPLLTRTTRPLAVAEGGYSSQDIGPFHGSEQDQIDYLTAIHSQIGSRLAFWIYLLLSDFNLESYGGMMEEQGHGGDIGTLGLFSAVGLREFDGTPKAALAVWDRFRNR